MELLWKFAEGLLFVFCVWFVICYCWPVFLIGIAGYIAYKLFCKDEKKSQKGGDTDNVWE